MNITLTKVPPNVESAARDRPWHNSSFPSGDVEQLDDRIREARELAERCNDADPVHVGRFIDAYASGEIQLGIRCALSEKTQYGFLIGAAHVRNRKGRKVPNGIPSHTQSRGVNLHREQSYMLSNNVEVMEGVKGFITSFVRFQRYDNVAFLGGEGLYEFMPFVVPISEGLMAGGNRKVSIVNKRWAVALSKGCGKNVEAASNGIDVSANLDLECERERFFLRSNNEIVRNIRWQLFDTYIHICVEPSVQPRLEGWEFGYGPVDRRLSI